MPSFVVTWRALVWQGALLKVLARPGSLNINDPKITGLANTFYSRHGRLDLRRGGHRRLRRGAALGYRKRVAAGLAGGGCALIVRFVLLAAVSIAAVAILNSDRGVPLAVMILLGFVVGMEFVTKRTPSVATCSRSAATPRRRAEPASASTRSGSPSWLAGSMAAIGGIMAASRLLAVNQNSGGNELLLVAIAGPVIAGTSLFGGRGSVWTALLGALVIGSISNGMDLLALSSR